MVPDRQEAINPEVPFDDWKSRFRRDCELQNKLAAFEALGDSVLKVLWESGISPTMKALLKDNEGANI
jgi:hypothetical protein